MDWNKELKINKVTYRVKKANNKKNKYVVYIVDGGVERSPVRFGALGMEHYKDKFKQYSKYDHKDKKRLENFRSRFGSQYEKIKNDPSSALFWSWNYLW